MRYTPWLTTPMRVAAVVVAAALLGATVGTFAQARQIVPQWSSYDDDIADAQREQQQHEEALERIEADLAYTDREIVAADRRLRELNERLPVVQEEYRLAQSRLDAALLELEIVRGKLEAAEAEDEALTDQIAADEDRVDELREMLAEIARTTYQDAQTDSSLAIIFGATTSQEFVDDATYRDTAARVQSNALAEVEEIAAINRNRAVRQEAVREYIEELNAQAEALVEESEIARNLAEEKKLEVEELLAEAEELRVYLESQREAYLARQAELEAAEAALQAELDELWVKKLEEEAVNGTGSLVKGWLRPPTAVPYITSSFGWRIHPIYGYNRLHAGTDFRAYCGTPIYAAAEGTVEWARWYGGYGNQVLVDHGIVSGKSVFTSYNHLSSYAVSSGQHVERGQLVGYSGTTGTSTACHLHFEVRVNGEAHDPMDYVADW